MKKRKQNRQRNLLHDHPLLRKGGVHEKSNKAKRRNSRQSLRKAWLFLSTLIECTEEKPRFIYSQEV
jgi:hypothetical protein